MENTIEVTIALDSGEIKKKVYAESALLGVMLPEVGRPKIISEDNVKLVNIFIESTFVELATMLKGFIDGKKFSLTDNSVYKFPLYVPSEMSGFVPVLRKELEEAIASGVLMRCYDENSQLRNLFDERMRNIVSRIRLALVGPDLSITPNY